MWHIDDTGAEFAGHADAFRGLRERALAAIAAGDRDGCNVRGVTVRLRAQTGQVLFEGTLDEASRLHIDGQVYVAATPAR